MIFGKYGLNFLGPDTGLNGKILIDRDTGCWISEN